MEGLQIREKRIPRPRGRSIDGPLPRPIFLAEIVQRNELRDKNSRTLYYTYDPARPDEGFQKVFDAPGESQYCRFLTPLYGGCGVAMGSVEPDMDPVVRRLFWFDLLGGEPGETIAFEPYGEWISGSEVLFRADGRVHRFDALEGTLRSYSIDLDLDRVIGEHTLIALIDVGFSADGGRRIIRFQMDEEKITDLGPVPPPLRAGSGGRLLPAGPDGRDGLYYVDDAQRLLDGFTLWYKPPDCRWFPVIRKVHVFKTFGGMPPLLPVAYLGNRRFAVARTVRDDVPGRPGEKRAIIPWALCSTLLIDGMTGRTLEETEPVIYDHNPSLEIPDRWWSEEARKLRDRKGEIEKKRPIQWDGEQGVYRYAGDRALRPEKDEEVLISSDGRYLAVYGKWSREEGPISKIAFRIIDGASGEERTHEVVRPAKTLLVNAAAWQILCSTHPDEIPEHFPARPHPFHDPW